MAKVLVNDQLIERTEAVIDIEDRGYQFGDGVYEVIRIYDGMAFTADEHLDRFFHSAEKIKMEMPFDKQQMLQFIEQLIKENNLQDGSIYMQVTRGATARNHLFPGKDIKPVLTAYTKEVARPEEKLENGVKAMVTEDIRWLRCDIKSLNLLPNVLAKQEAKEQDCYEAILHRNGTVTEGSSSNAYIIKDGKIITHPATNLILNGITRQVILQLCQANQIPVAEEEFHLDDLKTADEIFVSSTTSEVMPIVQLDGQSIGDGKPGPLTKKLQSLFLEKIEEVKTQKM
ncbi:D-amino-acid transaminase [Lederbergia galactosidilytica]|uniref:D-alanine aminotransferase n=1 Tax=Lederbergia galactosidilytica TaxID=217031 RepID=A0A177ZJX9_9BACI|nr:D-amino-acid transaminase [Lederbergia galactosidilytica]MBP1915286.1 D-alanine transaminase [Lederbergia galactosidilytica]OAK68115.1 D-alanine aminotransferase [Lederbergia galactosidilytica]